MISSLLIGLGFVTVVVVGLAVVMLPGMLVLGFVTAYWPD